MSQSWYLHMLFCRRRCSRRSFSAVHIATALLAARTYAARALATAPFAVKASVCLLAHPDALFTRACCRHSEIAPFRSPARSHVQAAPSTSSASSSSRARATSSAAAPCCPWAAAAGRSCTRRASPSTSSTPSPSPPPSGSRSSCARRASLSRALAFCRSWRRRRPHSPTLPPPYAPLAIGACERYDRRDPLC